MSEVLRTDGWWRLRRAGDSTLQVALTAVGWFGLALTVLVLALREATFAWQPIVVVAAEAHTLLFGAPVWAVVLIVARRWLTAAVAVVVLGLVVAVEVPLYVAATVDARGAELTVMQANLRLGRADAADLVRTVRTRGVDVLTAEEVTPQEHERLAAAGIATVLPYEYAQPRPDSHGVVLYSRYPLEGARALSGFQLGAVMATVRAPTQPVTVVAVHIAAPYPQSATGWGRELSRLRADLAGLPKSEPVVVGGDFNSTYDNAPFRDVLTDGFRDASDESGSGYNATYPADAWYPPLLAIDHVLVRHGDAVAVHTVTVGGSDHRGLIARLRVDSPAQLAG